MAKYIGTYENETAIQTAVTNNDLSRPFVALAEDTSRVYYGTYIDLAVIGDICVYDTTTQSLRFIHQADYNTTTYPTATYEPIGIIVTNQTSTLSSVNRNTKILAKNWLDKSNPETGNATPQSLEWGDATIATGATSTDGSVNTATVLAMATGQADWRTDSTISFTNGQRMYPLFECAWRLHTNGTAQGDWYIMSSTEYNNIINININTINSGFTAIGVSGMSNNRVWTSDEVSYLFARTHQENSYSNNQKSFASYCRALCEKAVLPINA